MSLTMKPVLRHFECLALVTVSKIHSVDNLLRVMVKEFYKVAKKENPSNLNELSYKELVETIVGDLKLKRYLVVLDEVWDVNLWRKINVALRDGLHREVE
ncbi:NB-ARC domain containing protein [Parasponia andersonii]|uniref:NB-ARC domain containing protein n=1 Tax=Parasponia andersonii TaxID=3476 RepID=A0A2P5AL57_PARAD|nr:NB-ARC domain containing protein [Parasponia andersonii]